MPAPGRVSMVLTYPGKVPAGEVVATPPAALLPAVAWHPDRDGHRNLLVHGDNLSALAALVGRRHAGELGCADGTAGARLAFIDPPFATGRQFRTSGGTAAYDDRAGGPAFIEFLRQRIILLHELLADDGTLWVHLDRRAVHHTRVICDEVFGGPHHLLNEVVWHYETGGAAQSSFAHKHDTLLVFVKDPDRYVFNTQREAFGSMSGFNRTDDDGRAYKDVERGGRTYRYYADEGRICHDVWDIDGLAQQPVSERVGYPTQKPEALLRRVIAASSNEGDLVIDAFAGSGTTLAVAEAMGRRWCGIDVGALSTAVTLSRLAVANAGPFDVEVDAAAPLPAAGEIEWQAGIDSSTLFQQPAVWIDAFTPAGQPDGDTDGLPVASVLVGYDHRRLGPAAIHDAVGPDQLVDPMGGRARVVLDERAHHGDTLLIVCDTAGGRTTVTVPAGAFAH